MLQRRTILHIHILLHACPNMLGQALCSQPRYQVQLDVCVIEVKTATLKMARALHLSGYWKRTQAHTHPAVPVGKAALHSTRFSGPPTMIGWATACTLRGACRDTPQASKSKHAQCSTGYVPVRLSVKMPAIQAGWVLTRLEDTCDQGQPAAQGGKPSPGQNEPWELPRRNAIQEEACVTEYPKIPLRVYSAGGQAWGVLSICAGQGCIRTSQKKPQHQHKRPEAPGLGPAREKPVVAMSPLD